jgi:hypothetical protein
MSWTCPKCERELLHENQWHYCVKVNLDSLFEGRSAELILVFDKILAEVADWEDVLVSTTPNCVVFVHRRTFFVIRPMQKQLELNFYSKVRIESPMIMKSNVQGGKYRNSVRITELTDLNPRLFEMIRESYKLL